MIINEQSFPTNEIPLAVVTSTTPWNEPPRIRHQITRQLARFYNVLYVGPPVQSFLGRIHDQLIQVQDRIIVCRVAIPLFTMNSIYRYISLIHKTVNGIITRRVEEFIKLLGYKDAVLINFRYDYGEIMSSPLFFPKIYFCNDEFPTRPKYKYCRDILSEYEDQVISRADICFAVSTKLEIKLREKSDSDNVRLLLPGHEFKANLLRAKQVANRKRKDPISVCFMGYVNSRLYLDWLFDVVSNTRLFLYMVGPIDGVDLSRFHALPNFKWIAPLEGQALQELLETMDVFVMPYNIELPGPRNTTAPNKLFQYLACGRPVVISNMPNFLQLPDKFIYKARNAKKFLEKIFEAYECDNEELVMARIKVAMQNTWNERGDYLQCILRSFDMDKK